MKDVKEDIDDYKRQMLIGFVSHYASKPDIKMKDLLHGIRRNLVRKKPITERQFIAIIRFVERERPFKGKSVEEIKEYFGVWIKGYRKESINELPATLYGL